MNEQLIECQGEREQLREHQQQQVTALQNQLRTMNEQLIECRGQREQLREHQQQQVTALQNQLRTRESEMNQMREQLREKQQQVTASENQLRTQEGEINQMREQLREKQQQVTALENQLRTREGEISQMREQLNESRGQEERLREREQLITDLQGQLTRGEQELRTMREQFSQEELLRAQQQQRVAELPRQVAILETELETVREQLNESQQREWVINRNDIQMLEQELGRGAWGCVYRGKFHGCDVAVKQMHENLITSDYTRHAFEREVGMASRCRHPCLLQFIGATTDERPLLVTEILDCSLREKLNNEDVTPLSANEVPVISRDVALGLNYLHQQPIPIIHHDVSSANVLLWRQSDRWRAKLSDYGTANFARQSNINYVGAMIYSAPEFLNEDHNQPISCKVDVYSFGVLLCEMCIRQEPDPQRRRRQIAAIRNGHFRALVNRCVNEVPGRRPNMESIIEELNPGEASESRI